MTTRFHLESWRKIYRVLPPSWLALPLSARGLGSELLKYVDQEGVFALPVGESEADGVCRIMCAHRKEWRRVGEDIAALLADGYLVRVPNGLKIRNYVEAQARTPSAERMARKRARDANSDGNGQRHSDANSDAGVTVTGASQSDGHDTTRHDTTRREDRERPASTPQPSPTEAHAPATPSPTQGPSPAEEPATSKPPKAARATRCPSSVDPKAAEWCRERGIPEPRGEVAKMLDHFAAKGGKDGAKADWGATWRNWERRAAEYAGGRGPRQSAAQSNLQAFVPDEEHPYGF